MKKIVTKFFLILKYSIIFVIDACEVARYIFFDMGIFVKNLKKAVVLNCAMAF